MKPSRSEYHTIRGLRYHVRTWGDPTHRKLVCLHGYLDVSATFQFLVDELANEWFVIAPDWRGYGLSEWAPQGYWLADYAGDLDALLRLYAPDAPVSLLSHSMATHVALMYAAARPERIAGIIALDGLVLRDMGPQAATRLLAVFLDELLDPPSFKRLANFDAAVAQVLRTSPRLNTEQARYLAHHRTEILASGEFRLRADPLHKATCPDPNRLDEMIECWRAIKAPVLLIDSERTVAQLTPEARAEIAAQRRAFARSTAHTISGAGHMLHHDAPAQVAALIEQFLAIEKAPAVQMVED